MDLADLDAPATAPYQTLHFGVISAGLTTQDLRIMVSNQLSTQNESTQDYLGTDEDSYLAWGEHDDDGTAHVWMHVPLGWDVPAHLPALRNRLHRLVAHPQSYTRIADWAVLTDGQDWSEDARVIVPSQQWSYTQV